MKSISRSYLLIATALIAGLISGLLHLEFLLKGAEAISSLFINFLKLVAAPIVFLSITSTLSGMKGFDEMKKLGKKVFFYTLLTTVVATVTALVLFLVIDPVKSTTITHFTQEEVVHNESYFSFLLNIVPSNFVKMFLENNVIAIAFVGFLAGIASLKLPDENRQVLHNAFSSFFKLILKITEFAILLMPIGIWAFTTLLVEELRHNFSQLNGLILYMSCHVGANLIQGFIFLPLLLKSKGLSPLKVAKGSFRALLFAFFSKSSNATLPLTLQCAQKQLGINNKIANFSLPLCTVINMNGCAAFMITTVLFVAGSHGIVFHSWDLALWVVLATIAAIGNAGVPMGCFFLSSAFLVAMNVPLATMGLILPFYAFLDMIETALNVWSDICVTSIVNQEMIETEEFVEVTV